MNLETHEAMASGALRPREPRGPKIFRWVIGIAIVVPFLWSAAGLNVSIDRLLSAPADIWNIVHRMFPPDLSPETVQRALPKVMESLFIAWVGTMMAAVISLPLSFLAARNVTSRTTSAIVRQIFIMIRSVPEVLLAMVLIPVTGLGAWTGTLAIGLHSIGTLGKLSSEVVEGIEPGPVEAVAGVGGTKLAQVRFGIVPQVMPAIMAYWLYRFEINIRASAVLGVVGAGGIGLELVNQLAFHNYARVGTVLLLTIVVVLVIDTISAKLRRRIITGEREPGPVAMFLGAGRTQRLAMITFAVLATWFIVFMLIQMQSTPA
ncbi:MAG: phosphonate ABC transporter, permease protein PhnE [Acidimicrobiia bacterium]